MTTSGIIAREKVLITRDRVRNLYQLDSSALETQDFGREITEIVVYNRGPALFTEYLTICHKTVLRLSQGGLTIVT